MTPLPTLAVWFGTAAVVAFVLSVAFTALWPHLNQAVYLSVGGGFGLVGIWLGGALAFWMEDHL